MQGSRMAKNLIYKKLGRDDIISAPKNAKDPHYSGPMTAKPSDLGLDVNRVDEITDKKKNALGDIGHRLAKKRRK